jgi:serine/threonine protein phosphatase PrpC
MTSIYLDRFEHFKGPSFEIGVVSTPGPANKPQEDRTVVHLSLPCHPETTYCAVFDGHAGDSVADQLAKELHIEIDKLPSFDDDGSLKKCFEQLDLRFSSSYAGSTAAVV